MFNEPKVEPPKTLWPQCIAGLTATIGGLILGSCIGWSGPAIPMLLNSTITDFSVTKTECNFVASLMPGESSTAWGSPNLVHSSKETGLTKII